MNCRIINNSDMNLDRLLPVLKLFLPYAQKHMGFDQLWILSLSQIPVTQRNF